MAQAVPQSGSKQMTLKYMRSGIGSSAVEYRLRKMLSVSPVPAEGMANTSSLARSLYRHFQQLGGDKYWSAKCVYCPACMPLKLAHRYSIVGLCFLTLSAYGHTVAH